MTLARFTLALAACLPLAAAATTVRVHYESPKSGLAIRGDKGPMSWSSGAPAKSEDGKVWTYTWPDQLGDVVMKPVLGEDKVAVGGTYLLAAGSTRDIYPFFGAPFGKLKIVPDFASPQLKNSRKLRIYLPPSYDENRAKRYPVLYMHDGQNLFDARTAAFGVEWGIDETLNRLVATGVMEEIIVVGIDNTPARLDEYTPCCDPQYGGGQIDTYQRFVVDTVKPYIDGSLRTLPGRESTAIMGSSLGGIASVYIAQKNAAVFSRAGSLSGSFWWNRQELVTALPPRLPLKIYLDAGTVKDGLEETTRMRDALLKQGYRQDADLFFHVAEGAGHNEKSWAARVDKALAWFFPWQ
jgi:predicted alpha/beta superfamily hydrolase